MEVLTKELIKQYYECTFTDSYRSGVFTVRFELLLKSGKVLIDYIINEEGYQEFDVELGKRITEYIQKLYARVF